ncbi:MAG: CapA family protein [Desulfobacterales bacterium]|nr:CapA family protein [Desulfobacterales bacterium]
MSVMKLLAVGDISLQTRNNQHPFEKVKQVLAGKDFLFGNLETVLSDQGKKAQKAVLLYSSPEMAGCLKDVAFDIVNIANNHIMDLGVEGFNGTLKILSKSNLTFIGANNRPDSSYAVLEKDGVKLGFLGYMEGGFSLPEKGVWINRIELADIVRDIEAIKVKCDFVIISLHWGFENIFYPSPKQIDLAHELIDAGATVILGHHPHVIQGIEQYKHGLIAYSLGNFQFDPNVSRTKTNSSMLLCLNFSKVGLESYHVIPIVINHNSVPAVAKDGEQILNLVSNISQPISNGMLTWGWWLEQIAGEYLSGNMRSYIFRIKKYGASHFLQCVRWLISPFCIRCYVAIIKRRFKRFLRRL